MKFELPPLPYAKDALEPHLGRETLEYHYEKHHRGYLEKLEAAIRGTPSAALSLEEIIRTAKGEVYNHASQVWNHTFYWESMKPGGGGRPKGHVRDAVAECFGSHEELRRTFVEAGAGQFGSGYVWLVLADERLVCMAKPDADSPLSEGLIPILNCDVWEHAYYLDFRNERERYLETFYDELIDWERVGERLARAREEGR